MLQAKEILIPNVAISYLQMKSWLLKVKYNLPIVLLLRCI